MEQDSAQKISLVQEGLRSWYQANARSLPWRNVHNPYGTWVSEIMLQQTRVETVIPYYLHFMELFPDIAALAKAPEEKVLKAWEGLGYYSRARNLQAGARQVMESYGGQLPADTASLEKIKGIGPYTAGAIASIAFGQQSAAVDGNVIRVVSRIFGIRQNVSECKKQLSALAQALVPPEDPGNHNQALMDLGASVCTPGTPDCHLCPLRACCDAFAAGDAAALPLLPRTRPQKVQNWDVLLLEKDGCFLLRQRKEKLLQGLWCFPMLEADPAQDAPDNKAGVNQQLMHHADHLGEDASANEAGTAADHNAQKAAALSGLILRKLGIQTTLPFELAPARHVFTHLIWQMRIWYASTAAACPAPDGYHWIAKQALPKLALPTALRVPLQLILKEDR